MFTADDDGPDPLEASGDQPGTCAAATETSSSQLQHTKEAPEEPPATRPADGESSHDELNHGQAGLHPPNPAWDTPSASDTASADDSAFGLMAAQADPSADDPASDHTLAQVADATAVVGAGEQPKEPKERQAVKRCMTRNPPAISAAAAMRHSSDDVEDDQMLQLGSPSASFEDGVTPKFQLAREGSASAQPKAARQREVKRSMTRNPPALSAAAGMRHSSDDVDGEECLQSRNSSASSDVQAFRAATVNSIGAQPQAARQRAVKHSMTRNPELSAAAGMRRSFDDDDLPADAVLKPSDPADARQAGMT